MCHVDLVGSPIRRPLRAVIRRHQCTPEEGQLVAEMTSLYGVQVSGVVPPLCLKVVVGPVIDGKLEELRPRNTLKALHFVGHDHESRLQPGFVPAQQEGR